MIVSNPRDFARRAWARSAMSLQSMQIVQEIAQWKPLIREIAEKK
jgi:hypothetical protein